MKERPILFSAPMVRAILDGKKTQTRRIVKPQPSTGNRLEWLTNIVGHQPSFAETKPLSCDLVREVRCPYGVPGDRLWVREAFALAPACSDPDPEFEDDWHVVYRASEADSEAKWIASDGRAVSPWKPSIHMPRWASRITLEIAEVRVERLHDISEADCWAEGIDEIDGMLDDAEIRRAAKLAGCSHEDARATFAALWERINGERRARVEEIDESGPTGRSRVVVDRSASWAANPWVWALTFKRIEAPS